MKTKQDSYLFVCIFIDACTCVRACVWVGIKPSAAPGRAAAAPAKCQMVGIDMASCPPPPSSLLPHRPHTAADSSTCLLSSSQDLSFCSLFAERKLSLRRRTPPPPPSSTLQRSDASPLKRPWRSPSAGRPADYVRYGSPRRKYHRRKNKQARKSETVQWRL